MQKQELIRRYQQVIDNLNRSEGFEPQRFEVDRVPDFLPATNIVQIEQEGWDWGYCISETCNHHSHDPRMTGPAVTILCRPVTAAQAMWIDEAGDQIYLTPSGLAFTYYERSNGDHFKPSQGISQKVTAGSNW